MKLFNWEITKSAKTARPIVANSNGSFAGTIKEAFTGSWQRNIEYTNESVLTNPTLFRCINLIASDIGKLRLQLSLEDSDGIWTNVDSPSFSPVLRKSNPYQSRQQFIENWIHSKLTNGNTYVLKRRDARNVVISLHILEPNRVTPLITEDGEIYYDLRHDDLAKINKYGLVVLT